MAMFDFCCLKWNAQWSLSKTIYWNLKVNKVLLTHVQGVWERSMAQTDCCMKWRSWGWTAQIHSTRTGLQPPVWHCEESSLLFLGQTVLTWHHPWWCLRLSNEAFFPSSGDLDDNTKLKRKMMSWTLMFYWLRSFSVYKEESKTVSP